jgi:hypothetical protein
MAYAGYGVWALVGQQLISAIALCIIMWFTVKWRPKLLFSLTRVKELFSLEALGYGRQDKKNSSRGIGRGECFVFPSTQRSIESSG